MTRMLPLMNTQQYLGMRHEAFANDGKSPTATDYDINGTWDSTRYTDWQKLLIGNTAQYTDANASVSGGNANTQFLVGGGYHRETTVFPGSLSDQKGSAHFSITNTSPNKKFHLQLSGNYMIDDNKLISTDLTYTAIRMPPDAPGLYNPDGTLNWAPQNGNSTWQNPLSYLTSTYRNTTKNLISNLLLSYELLPGLDVKSSFGYNDLQNAENIPTPAISTAPELRPFFTRYAYFANSDITSWIIEPQLSYSGTIKGGKLQALVGTTIEQNNSNSKGFLGQGFSSDVVMDDLQAAPSVTTEQDIEARYKYNALFGRITYDYADKYLINLTARRDGSSRFGPQNELHDFGAIGAGWIFSQERLIKNNLSILSFGKLRGSYGTTGNDQIGDYQFLSLYNPTSVPNAYQGSSGLLPNGLSNPYLQWGKDD